MTLWNGVEWNDRGILAWLAEPPAAVVPEGEQCVNCTARAEDNGWCGPCWSTIVPTA